MEVENKVEEPWFEQVLSGYELNKLQGNNK